MRHALTLSVVVLATVLHCVAAKETVQELAARAEAARPEDRPGQYVGIAERQLKAVDQLFGANKDDEAEAALKDVVTYSEKAHEAAIAARSKLKNTEIALRKMAVKLRDIKRTLSFEEQAPVQTAADRLESLRTDLLSKMFGKGK
jgi:hypothetical protein